MPLPLPPVEEQHEIVRRASAMLASADEVLERIASVQLTLDRVATATLAQAFRGHIDPVSAATLSSRIA
jgi:type I restriction enzyme S subunit